jgi:hypothetical protein
MLGPIEPAQELDVEPWPRAERAELGGVDEEHANRS